MLVICTHLISAKQLREVITVILSVFNITWMNPAFMSGILKSTLTALTSIPVNHTVFKKTMKPLSKMVNVPKPTQVC
jgi:hypothetical protein